MNIHENILRYVTLGLVIAVVVILYSGLERLTAKDIGLARVTAENIETPLSKGVLHTDFIVPYGW